MRGLEDFPTLSAAVWPAFTILASGLAFSQPVSDAPARLPTFAVKKTAPRVDDITRSARAGRAIETLTDSLSVACRRTRAPRN